MPWKVINQMDLKKQFVTDHLKEHLNITDLSQKYGISRPTVYKWLKRYKRRGYAGLKEQSRAPRHCPHRTSKRILELIVKEKLRKPKRGPKKIRVKLKQQYPHVQVPAVSTISYWLKKEGLVKQRKIRKHVAPYSEPLATCRAPNDVWSIDYKGQFYMRNKRVCYPLTISDNFSRYVLGCKALAGPRYSPTKRYLISIFREYGLPAAMRSDNGTPFAGKGIGGLSRLSVWFILQGIVPERITKGCPQENPRHERMHRTLKDDLLDEPAANLRAQQMAFEAFCCDFNHDRPHESLDDRTPGELYVKSQRPYVERPHPPEYGYDYTVRHVRQSGEIKFKGQLFFVSQLLTGLPVGLKEIDDGLWQIQFSFYTLGSVDLRKNKIIGI